MRWRRTSHVSLALFRVRVVVNHLRCSRPVPFKAKITPRFREAQAIVEQEQEVLGYH